MDLTDVYMWVVEHKFTLAAFSPFVIAMVVIKILNH